MPSPSPERSGPRTSRLPLQVGGARHAGVDQRDGDAVARGRATSRPADRSRRSACRRSARKRRPRGTSHPSGARSRRERRATSEFASRVATPAGPTCAATPSTIGSARSTVPPAASTAFAAATTVSASTMTACAGPAATALASRGRCRGERCRDERAIAAAPRARRIRSRRSRGRGARIGRGLRG